MKLLVSSYRFKPDIGGIETVGELLCCEFTSAGHEVAVLTESSGGFDAPYRIIRRPSRVETLQWHRWADLVFHNNICMRHAWPLAIIHRPWVVAVHTWIARVNGALGFRDRLKRRILKRARVVAISQAVAASLPFKSTIIPDPYDSGVYQSNGAMRNKAIVYVGRIVPDKGVDILIHAAAHLNQCGHAIPVHIVGDGPARPEAEALVRSSGLSHCVTFHGQLLPPDIARLLAASRIMAVPSRWEEPFGVVALEGLASGCVVIAADRGGLPEACGNCGILFRGGDAGDLAEKIQLVLDGRQGKIAPEILSAHLQRHEPARIAKRYLDVFEAELRGAENTRSIL